MTNTATIDSNVICELDEFTVIKVSGNDAPSFLQGQFSNDVNALENGQCQLNSYNSPKGRMYASFYLAKLEDAYYITIPQDICDMVVKRLRMFVMRAAVTLDPMENDHCFGVSGKKICDKLSSIVSLPGEVFSATQKDSDIFLKIGEQRILCFGENVNNVLSALNIETEKQDSKYWRRLDINSGIPNIFSSSQEEFVPQMVNFALIGGVSFTKGCYPGQEVVARMHYLGKLKKRMYRISLTSDDLPTPAENIYQKASENTQSVGQIVDAQYNEQGNIDALAVLQINSAENSALCVGSVNGPEITIESLPYAFEEQK